MRSRPRRARRGTTPRTTNSMCTCSTTPRRRATERTSIWPARGWGTLTINGDYLWLENLTIEHATPEGLRVNTSATGTVLKRITALATIVNLRGVNTLAEDLNVSHVIRQRTDPVECYDANPAFGVGRVLERERDRTSAWASALEGSTGSSGQIVRRAFVHRSWNGVGDLRREHTRALQALGVSEPHARRLGNGQHHPTQRLCERAGLDLLTSAMPSMS